MLQGMIRAPRFLSAGELVMGPGSIGALRALSGSRIAVLATPSIYKNDDLMATVSKAMGTQHHVRLSLTSGEPKLSGISSPLKEVMEFAPDWIVGIGGGAALDQAKMVWVYYEHPDLDPNQAQRFGGVPNLRGKAKFAAVPTTSGTGSEVSSSAVFEGGDGGKQFMVSHQLLPDVAVLDPNFVVSCPAPVTAWSGLDALSHLIEGYVSKSVNPFLDGLVEGALPRIFENLPKCVASPTDLAARGEMMHVATIAGWNQNQKIPGVGHAIAHQMGRFQVPHGYACGVLLGNSIRANATQPDVALRYDRLAKLNGLKNYSQLADRCDQLVGELGLSSKLGALAKGGREAIVENMAEIADGACQDICSRYNPRPADADLVQSILSMSL